MNDKQSDFNHALFLNSILQSATEYSIVAKDLNGNVLAWNEGAKRIYGYEPNEILGKSAFILYDPKDVESGFAIRILDEVKKNGVWSGKLRRVRKDGSKFIAYATITLRKDENGKPLGFTLISRDLTEEQKIAKALRESQEYNRALFESAIDALIAINEAGIITDINQQMSYLTNESKEEIIGKHLKIFFSIPEDAEKAIKKGFEEEGLQNYYLTIRARCGRETPVSINATLFRNEEGETLGLFFVARDITEQKLFEQTLKEKNDELEKKNKRIEEANRLKSEFLANMSHELRTPLNAIIGFAELMFAGKVGPVSPEHKEYLGDILSSSQHLLQLINDVLDLAKVESGKMEFYPETVDLNKLISEVRDIMHSLISKKRIDFLQTISPKVTNVVVDPSKLKQVLYNFLSNSIKFTDEKGKIEVSVTEEDENHFRLSVKDTGIGIKEEDFAKLFIEFQQVDSTISKKYQGTGLGLSLTKRIVEAQKGQVGFESKYGKGSCFYVILPKVPDDLNQPKKFLVIEDDEFEQKLIVQTLLHAGFQAIACKNAFDALDWIKKESFDVITLDLLLPDLSGWSVLHQIRASQLNNRAPVIVLTRVKEDLSYFRPLVNEIIVKPIDPNSLIQAVQHLGFEIKK